MTWKKLELIDADVLMCDKCEQMISNKIVYCHFDDLSSYINEVRCKKCYYQGCELK